jgi:hypothetical protein
MVPIKTRKIKWMVAPGLQPRGSRSLATYLKAAAGITILMSALCAGARASAAQGNEKSSGAQAAPAVTPKSADEQAKEYFEMAVEAFARESYGEALSFFQESYKLNPKPKVLYNIAMCQRALMDFKAAIDTFREYLDKGGKKIGKGKRKEIEKLIAEMETSLGKITVTVNENGASILVDGVEAGISPIQAILAVNPGTHTVEAGKKGFQRAIKTVKVKSGGHEAVSLTMVPEAAGAEKVMGAVPVESEKEKKKKKKRITHAVLWSVLGVVLVGAGTAGGILIWQHTAGGESVPSADWTVHGR